MSEKNWKNIFNILPVVSYTRGAVEDSPFIWIDGLVALRIVSCCGGGMGPWCVKPAGPLVAPFVSMGAPLPPMLRLCWLGVLRRFLISCGTLCRSGRI